MNFCLYFTKTLGDNRQVRPPLSPHFPKHSQKSCIEFSFITFQCYKSQSQCLFYPKKLKNVPRVLLLQSVLPKKKTFQKQNVVFFFKDKQKSSGSLCGCFAFLSNFDFSWLSQPFQTFPQAKRFWKQGWTCPMPFTY